MSRAAEKSKKIRMKSVHWMDLVIRSPVLWRSSVEAMVRGEAKLQLIEALVGSKEVKSQVYTVF